MWWIAFIGLLLVGCQSSGQTEETKNTLVLNTVEEENVIELIDSAEIDTNYFQLRFSPATKAYVVLKVEIKNQQNTFKTAYTTHNNQKHQDSIIQQAANYLTETLVNQIIPYWYGTAWSFDGYTDKPNNGEVGCSYFVSTTLLHAGFNLNRYKLAQQGPLSEAKSLQLQDTVRGIEGLENLHQQVLADYDDGLFFIGLEHYHVGYLLKRKGELFFIQSSYDDSMAVIIEKALHSEILASYSTFWLVPITAQKELISRWILKESIEVIKGKE